MGLHNPAHETAVVLLALVCLTAAILLFIDTFWWSWEITPHELPPLTTDVTNG